MLIDKLQTPHPEHVKPGEIARPVLDAIGVDRLRQELESAHSKGPDAYARAISSKLPGALEHIRRSLWFNEDLAPDAGTTLDSASKTGETNCFGYALATSQALGQLGVRHWIGIMGNHATPLVPLESRGTEKLFVADAYDSAYTGYITTALRRSNIRAMRQEMSEQDHPRGVAMLDLRALPSKFQRLSHKLASTMDVQSIGDAEQDGRTLVLSTFHPEVGERVLQGSAEFHAAAARGNYQAAANALHKIPGLYFDIDARAPHLSIRLVVAGLCEAGNLTRATQAIDDYCSSFKRTRDARLTELRADLLATVAQHGGDGEVYANALAAYKLAADRARLAPAQKNIHAKIAALTALYDEGKGM